MVEPLALVGRQLGEARGIEPGQQQAHPLPRRTLQDGLDLGCRLAAGVDRLREADPLRAADVEDELGPAQAAPVRKALPVR